MGQQKPYSSAGIWATGDMKGLIVVKLEAASDVGQADTNGSYPAVLNSRQSVRSHTGTVISHGNFDACLDCFDVDGNTAAVNFFTDAVLDSIFNQRFD